MENKSVRNNPQTSLYANVVGLALSLAVIFAIDGMSVISQVMQFISQFGIYIKQETVRNIVRLVAYFVAIKSSKGIYEYYALNKPYHFMKTAMVFFSRVIKTYALISVAIMFYNSYSGPEGNQLDIMSILMVLALLSAFYLLFGVVFYMAGGDDYYLTIEGMSRLSSLKFLRRYEDFKTVKDSGKTMVTYINGKAGIDYLSTVDINPNNIMSIDSNKNVINEDARVITENGKIKIISKSDEEIVIQEHNSETLKANILDMAAKMGNSLLNKEGNTFLIKFEDTQDCHTLAIVENHVEDLRKRLNNLSDVKIEDTNVLLGDSGKSIFVEFELA